MPDSVKPQVKHHSQEKHTQTSFPWINAAHSHQGKHNKLQFKHVGCYCAPSHAALYIDAHTPIVFSP